MAKVYGEIDTLRRLLSRLRRAGIHSLSGIDDIEKFLGSFRAKMDEIRQGVDRDIKLKIVARNNEILHDQELYQQKVNAHASELVVEKEDLTKKLEDLAAKKVGFFAGIPKAFKVFFAKRRFNRLANHFDKEMVRPFKRSKRSIDRAKKRLHKLKNLPEKRIEKIVCKRGSGLLRTKYVLDRNFHLVAGAIGEYKACCELGNLPNSYYVINDFQKRFRKPIYNRRTDQRIYSIQCDHVVVGPSGIFLIETKNWSRATLDRTDLYSPVDQVKRAGFGLFCYLNTCINRGFLAFFKRDKKIQIRNIVLVVNNKPQGEFDRVKVLDLSQVNRYILYFKPVYSDNDIEEIVSHLL